MSSYINITFKARTTANEELAIDLRVPLEISVSQLISLVGSGLKSQGTALNHTISQVIRVETKDCLLVDSDRLANFPVTNGDVFRLLN